MIGIRILAFQCILLLFVSVSSAEERWCANTNNSRPLKFELLKSNKEYSLILLEGFILKMLCCVVSTNPSVSWIFNGKPIEAYGGIFDLSEKGQFLQSAGEALVNNAVLEGIYNCTAVQGNETVSATYNVKRYPKRNEACSSGKTTDIKPNYPPNSIYNLLPNRSLELECTMLLTCHPAEFVDYVTWRKYYWRSNANRPSTLVPVFELARDEPYDNETGNFVVVTTRKLNYSRVLVTSTLHIVNITDDDLHDPYLPDGYANLSCLNKRDPGCLTNRTRNYFQCFDFTGSTHNPLQKALKRSVTTTLFSGSPPTPVIRTTEKSGYDNLKEDGTIIGSTICGAFILISVLALVYVAYEWHIKLYFRRILLQFRGKNTATTVKYEYNCYVVCCNKDEKFVYEVLRSQLEDQHGYKLCLPERDFPIGTAMPDEIERCIRSSEYFMAVISPGFWDTAWCNLSVDMALRTNTKIVAVMSKEISKKEQSKDNRLLTALKSPGCTVIQANLLNLERSSEKLVLRLRYAMPRCVS